MNNSKIDDLPEKFRPFYRRDWGKWNMIEVYFGAVFLFPVRAVGLLLSVSWCWLCFYIGTIGVTDYEAKEYSK